MESCSFGVGNVSFHGGTTLSSFDGTHTLGNAIQFSSGGVSSYTFRAFDGPLTFSGAVTLANNTTVRSARLSISIHLANRLNVLPIPGPASRRKRRHSAPS